MEKRAQIAPYEIFDQALRFRNAAHRCRKTEKDYDESIGVLEAPAIVCCAMSIELYLKYIIFYLEKRLANGHNINTLFYHIPQKQQEDIIRIMGTNEGFNDRLIMLSSALTKWRYAYEYRELSSSFGFYFELMETFHTLCTKAPTE